MYFIGVLLLSFLTYSTVAAASSEYTTATVYFSSEGFEIKYGVLDKKNGIAFGSYNRSQNESGWGILNIDAGYFDTNDGGDPDLLTASAAGILEAALTQREIYDMYRSQMEFWFDGAPTETVEKAKAFYKNQRTWMENIFRTSPMPSEEWEYIRFIYLQFQGLKKGYSMVAPPNETIDDFGFDFLSGNGDWLDIQNIVDKTGFFKQKMEFMPKGRCSVLFKVLPGYENIYAAHSTWYLYSSMLRIYKHYSFNLQKLKSACKTMSFSSYPGYLSSVDDFFIMDSKLLMLQTTNPVYNHDLYANATSSALLAWHRVRLANMLADNGRTWSEYMRKYNSGTYNNQYMVLDLKKVKLNKEIEDDALWVVEQIPGLVEAADQTAILREGYWASYNVPFFKTVAKLSGVPSEVAEHGPDVSHDLAPRAKIFRRDQSKVVDMDSMKYIMRYNGYKLGDPYSEGSPNGAICSRGDLITDHPSAGGCTDTKITDFFLAQSMTAIAKNGPTHTNGLPVFSWSNFNSSIPHYGQADVFNYDWLKVMPETF